jgi:Winged helix-turn helix
MEIPITAEQREEVEQQLRRTDLTRRMRERLEMVKAAALGDDVARIARWSGRSVARVEHWLARFTSGGVMALADAPRSGRPAPGVPLRRMPAMWRPWSRRWRRRHRRWACPSTCGPRSAWRPIWRTLPSRMTVRLVIIRPVGTS